MSAERVTLTDEERDELRAKVRVGDLFGSDPTIAAVERIIAAREKALREEIAADLLAQAARYSDKTARHSTWSRLVSEYSACARTYDHAARIARGQS